MLCYKYRSVNQQTLEMLINREVYFASPDQLNDPLDAKIDINAHYQKIVRKYDPNISEEFNRKAFLLNLLNSKKVTLEDGTEKRLNDLVQEFITSLGIFSLSKTASDALLWSHYGGAHKGLCLEFESDEISSKDVFSRGEIAYKQKPIYEEVFEELLLDFGNFVKPWEKDSSYSDEVADKFYTKQLSDLIDANLYVKSEKWKYEEEYRLVSNKAGKIKFNASALKKIILGIHTSSYDINTIKNILTHPQYEHVKLMRVSKNPNGFDFNIVEI
ncbi:hypothetical protein ymoll0001_2550 [Yersinia mollaretii ATCC 43969]|uniref:DUF2971 domain-containing protein n=1 Tax=Yersinia mollaretii (strain ATCC 43969 / DSM 18520 / CIP 103324 / CNY 7263 / WAIP 204) TaxID=349967 RepID=A0ABP2EFV1_YERMW|nr:DUF2971 domain-containing protein [Yersinia mollaretii]EEQ10949.1 hypothetical protein ymoll0001_2550 [Yersinia mollaretii ATCC 43969]QKJ02582.1 DUF2971 domain-containing protein [Yersinia mollaretii ATCC 43969]